MQLVIVFREAAGKAPIVASKGTRKIRLDDAGWECVASLPFLGDNLA